MFEYEPVYNLLAKYEYVVVEPTREPADITLPVALTREGVEDVRARTVRFADVVLLLVVWEREVTPREDTFVERVGVIPREETVRVAVAVREAVALDAVGVVDAARDVVERDTLVRLVALERGLWRPVDWFVAFVSNIGSANTERIEINVEQTKNAAANKNTVPIAFLQQFVFIRKVM